MDKLNKCLAEVVLINPKSCQKSGKTDSTWDPRYILFKQVQGHAGKAEDGEKGHKSGSCRICASSRQASYAHFSLVICRASIRTFSNPCTNFGARVVE
jgi:hypothetical protein